MNGRLVSIEYTPVGEGEYEYTATVMTRAGKRVKTHLMTGKWDSTHKEAIRLANELYPSATYQERGDEHGIPSK